MASPDERLRGRANASTAALKQLGRELREHKVSVKTRLLLARLAMYPPPIRLMVNLKRLLECFIHGPIYNVLIEGLTETERRALIELDTCGISTESREVAHGLLNVHERFIAMRSLRGFFKAACAAKDEYLSMSDHTAEQPKDE